MTTSLSRRDALALGLGAAALTRPAVLRAQERWPTRPIEMVVGFAAGGGTDTNARVLAAALEKVLGGQVVVVNRPGASGELALAGVARAAPDGHTLGVTNYPGFLSIPIERKASFGIADFTLIANIVSDPSSFTVAAESAIRDAAGLIARAKEKPGALTYGSTGVGTDDHLALSLFETLAGVKLSHVPYRGAAPLGTDLLGRHVEVAGLNVSEALPLGDKVRMIFQGGAKRSRFAPDIPTFGEAGLAFEMRSERGLVAPAGLPESIERRLSEAVATVAGDADFVRRIESQFTEPFHLPAAAWMDHLRREDEVLRRLWREKPWSG